MNSRDSMNVLKGYAIFLLCLFIFTMWGINLFSLSQVEVTSFEEDPKKVELVEIGGLQTYKFKPKPFLYYYFKEMGYFIAMLPKPPQDNRRPMLLIDPPAKIDINLLREVFAWIRNGGTLMVFTPSDHAMDKISGIIRHENESEAAEDLYTHLPYLYGIEKISPVKKSMLRNSDASHISVFAERASSSNIFITFKGSGRIVLLAHPEMTSGEGLKLADNVVLVTRLVEFASPDKHLYILDTEPDLKIQARARQLVKRTGVSQVKKKIDHYSFWSLIKANPISWVLAQMAIALVVYFYSSGRRFGRARRLIDQESASASYLVNLGRLLEANGDSVFALRGILKDFTAAATRRFGLEPDAGLNQIIAEIEAADADVAKSLKKIEKDVFLITSGVNPLPESLLRVVRTLESARKELKLYD